MFGGVGLSALPHQREHQVLSTNRSLRALVIGIGNLDRGDDGAGVIAARQLRAAACPDVQILELSGEASELIDIWQTTPVRVVYLIDAMFSGVLPGTVRQFDARSDLRPIQVARRSTHAYGVAHAIELARVLDCLPEHIEIYAIEGTRFELGAAISPRVLQAIQTVVIEVIVSIAGASLLSSTEQ